MQNQNLNPYAKTYASGPADTAARAQARDARKKLIKEQLIPQLQQNTQLMEIIHTVLQDQQDIDILNELFGEMTVTSGSGSRGGKKRRRTLRRRMTKRRRHY